MTTIEFATAKINKLLATAYVLAKATGNLTIQKVNNCVIIRVKRFDAYTKSEIEPEEATYSISEVAEYRQALEAELSNLAVFEQDILKLS